LLKTCGTCWYFAADGETVRTGDGFCNLDRITVNRKFYCDHWCSLAKGPKRITLKDLDPELYDE
jgi:hypothetical protein